MVSFIALVVALFVYNMTIAGVINAVGSLGTPPYDIAAAADLLRTIYLKAFGIHESIASPLSFALLGLPAILAFYTITAILGRRQQ